MDKLNTNVMFTLLFTATNSFCSTTPETWEVTLPTGCTHNGNRVLDRGHCSARLCSGGGEVGCLAADTQVKKTYKSI